MIPVLVLVSAKSIEAFGKLLQHAAKASAGNPQL
jgi:hypothetical protein